MSRYVSYRDFDWVLLGFVLLICGMGVMEIHSATMHTKFGELSALMTSGYIVAEGYLQLKDDLTAIALFSELLKRLGVAECLQWRLRRQPLGIEDWRRIAGEDTGSMFEVCSASVRGKTKIGQISVRMLLQPACIAPRKLAERRFTARRHGEHTRGTLGHTERWR